MLVSWSNISKHYRDNVHSAVKFVEIYEIGN